MIVLRAVVPSLALVACTLMGALPWGLAPNARLVPPMLIAALLFFWNSRRRNAVPEWIAFACGLAMDAASHGPLGFWALVYLLAFVLAAVLRHSGRAADPEHVARNLLHYLVAVILLAFTAWILASLYALGRADPAAPALAALVAAMAYPVIAGLVGVLDPHARGGSGRTLVPGG